MRHLIFAFLLLLSTAAHAQQVPMLARYQFAPLYFSPAMIGQQAGVQVRAVHRSQWLGIDGAPSTQVLQADGSFAARSSAWGVLVSHDQAGALAQTDMRLAYGYRLRLTDTWGLRTGLSANLRYWRADWSRLTLQQQDDPSFQTDLRATKPNFGAGVVLSDGRWQLGLSVPNLVRSRLLPAQAGETDLARSTPDLYLSASSFFDSKNGLIRWQPMLLLRSADLLTDDTRTPTTADLGLTCHVRQRLRVGANWRTALERSRSSDDALGLSAGWAFANGLECGVVYDLPLSPIRRSTAGSVEVMLGYIFTPKKTPSPLTPSPLTPPPLTPNPPVDAPSDDVFPCQVSGIVFDMTTGLPAENARVTLRNTCGAAEPRAYITSADGRYRFQLQPGCCHTVTAQADGRQTANSEQVCPTRVARAQVFRVDLDLKK
jgi:type IX secretion system PorP/SprF family membrane protein